MNLRFVEAFYWVASLKSISRAAEKLYLTQSAMSSRIATLEGELGVLLLDRHDKQFKLTAAGTRFLLYAEKLLSLQREVKAEMGSGQAMAVSMRIGAIESVLHSWLIPWLEKLRADHPGLELELTVETTPILVDQIQRGTLDLVFAVLPAAADGVRNQALPTMDMVFVGHPELHKKRNYRLDELAEMELLTFQKGSQPHVTLLDLFRTRKMEPKKVHAISSISAMVQLVQGGFGVALLPRAAVERLTGFARLKPLTCDVQLQSLPIHASYRTDPTSRTVETVLQSAVAFAGGAKKRTKTATKGKPVLSKKSMI
ncbi:MAG: LysR substrate-binding domain-containing protein [Polaromonas sp.]|uniref:LysR family transcriptional regulator n=1 Tax=Polaromonas sp. TaxID=1869339 RepID=UPI00272F2F26|nr:LysR family transcriptional regulator [Polaromonas sp.]MDP1739774.1 LysR substrate-binding domain-containing protein [Polaromonas sp.]MDP1955798.1 LysR substrate-binding domain-containing protein [Polaromonas sp.]MDP3356538.1 LysR substrate-binding domain-containing protein [Polaromonas sp.]MDP3751606.1 LysR substrate-binding domain-containing protein [Polaromonas sp.]